ncbi:hypothetical protein G5I_03887 [Acromyrmex echinatior]|uniref:Uncharacterized protein n=1 Tax=Acromyrmex echinatior TaxID=103372 RepID=F4WE56_ACREC|nr:hypothetical protein G5I_03887 [Acromyrmex echinatior]
MRQHKYLVVERRRRLGPAWRGVAWRGEWRVAAAVNETRFLSLALALALALVLLFDGAPLRVSRRRSPVAPAFGTLVVGIVNKANIASRHTTVVGRAVLRA